MEAVQLRQIDMDYRNHLQAYLNFLAKAEKKAGKGKTKPVFTTFKKFYDYQKELKRVKQGTSPEKVEKHRFSGIGRFLNKGD